MLGEGAMVTIGKLADVYAKSTKQLADATGIHNKRMLTIGSAENRPDKLTTHNNPETSQSRHNSFSFKSKQYHDLKKKKRNTIPILTQSAAMTYNITKHTFKSIENNFSALKFCHLKKSMYLCTEFIENVRGDVSPLLLCEL